jgi:hypothetical protein
MFVYVFDFSSILPSPVFAMFSFLCLTDQFPHHTYDIRLSMIFVITAVILLALISMLRTHQHGLPFINAD